METPQGDSLTWLNFIHHVLSNHHSVSLLEKLIKRNLHKSEIQNLQKLVAKLKDNHQSEETTIRPAFGNAIQSAEIAVTRRKPGQQQWEQREISPSSSQQHAAYHNMLSEQYLEAQPDQFLNFKLSKKKQKQLELSTSSQDHRNNFTMNSPVSFFDNSFTQSEVAGSKPRKANQGTHCDLQTELASKYIQMKSSIPFAYQSMAEASHRHGSQELGSLQNLAPGASTESEYALKSQAAKSLAREFTNLLEMNKAQEIAVAPKKRRFVIQSTDASKSHSYKHSPRSSSKNSKSAMRPLLSRQQPQRTLKRFREILHKPENEHMDSNPDFRSSLPGESEFMSRSFQQPLPMSIHFKLDERPLPSDQVRLLKKPQGEIGRRLKSATRVFGLRNMRTDSQRGRYMAPKQSSCQFPLQQSQTEDKASSSQIRLDEKKLNQLKGGGSRQPSRGKIAMSDSSSKITLMSISKAKQKGNLAFRARFNENDSSQVPIEQEHLVLSPSGSVAALQSTMQSKLTPQATSSKKSLAFKRLNSASKYVRRRGRPGPGGETRQAQQGKAFDLSIPFQGQLNETKLLEDNPISTERLVNGTHTERQTERASSNRKGLPLTQALLGGYIPKPFLAQGPPSPSPGESSAFQPLSCIIESSRNNVKSSRLGQKSSVMSPTSISVKDIASVSSPRNQVMMSSKSSTKKTQQKRTAKLNNAMAQLKKLEEEDEARDEVSTLSIKKRGSQMSLTNSLIPQTKRKLSKKQNNLDMRDYFAQIPEEKSYLGTSAVPSRYGSRPTSQCVQTQPISSKQLDNFQGIVSKEESICTNRRKGEDDQTTTFVDEDDRPISTTGDIELQPKLQDWQNRQFFNDSESTWPYKQQQQRQNTSRQVQQILDNMAPYQLEQLRHILGLDYPGWDIPTVSGSQVLSQGSQDYQSQMPPPSQYGTASQVPSSQQLDSKSLLSYAQRKHSSILNYVSKQGERKVRPNPSRQLKLKQRDSQACLQSQDLEAVVCEKPIHDLRQVRRSNQQMQNRIRKAQLIS